MNKKEAIEALDSGYSVTHKNIGEDICINRGESNRLINFNRKTVDRDYFETAPSDGWEIFRNTRTIYFRYGGDRDVDASKAVITEHKDGDIMISTYDCLDHVRNRIPINQKGVKKLQEMERAIKHAQQLLEVKIKEKAKIEPINFKQWQEGMEANNCFMFNNWYYECQAHQNYLDEKNRVKPIFAVSPDEMTRYSSIRKTRNGKPMVVIIEYMSKKLNYHTQTKKYGFEDQQTANDWIMEKIEGKGYELR